MAASTKATTTTCVAFIAALVVAATTAAWADDTPISEATEECLVCHESLHPGIVADWRTSRHSTMTPQETMAKPEMGRRISATAVADSLKDVAVGCYECHSLNGARHADNFEHNGYRINVIVSPKDCETCHPVEVEEYADSKKAHAIGNLRKNPVYHSLVKTITRVKTVSDSGIEMSETPGAAELEGCFACHGTVVGVEGMKTVEVDGEEVEIPNLTNWPNQGVGRINPDGSMGACTACHPRHSFSIEMARKPRTCAQCHLAPDVPAWDVYQESKHGNIMLSMGDTYDWNAVPWKVGEDFRAPTCAVCHNSLITSPDGEVIAERTHDFGSRLWVRLFGLIYTHPQPKSGDTSIIVNADGLPLPTTFTGARASEYLIDADEQAARHETMTRVCRGCHSSDWAAGHFAKLDRTLEETDAMTLAATQELVKAWEKSMADKTNPFDEAIEIKWLQQWLFYANSVRYASAMGGPDYAAFKNGWWSLTKNLQEMHEKVAKKE